MYILHDNYYIIQRYKTEHGAKIGFTRKWKAIYPNATILSLEEFSRTEPMVETVNLMNGARIMIHKSLKGGCCDPGTERYWTM